MKSYLSVIGVIVFWIVLPISLGAQVPNGGFEQWSEDPTLGVLMPDEWSSIAMPGVAVPVISSTTSHSGSLAARGEVLNTGLPSPIDRLNPLLISIPPESSDFGFSVTEKYTELTGFYQFSSVGDDEFHVIVTMLNDTNSVGNGCISFPSSMLTYTPFTVEINYYSDINPNYCMIMITICPATGTNKTHTGSYFLVDDLDLGGSVTVLHRDEELRFPESMILEQNYPNPFNSQTRISYELDQHGPVRLSIFDGNGRLIRNLVDSDESAGSKYVIWDGMDVQGNQVASGIYLYRLKTLAGMEIKKMILQK